MLAPFVGPRTAQPSSRYALTAAIVDRHTVDVGAYRAILGVDHAIYRGKWRSDKGPGQPLLAVPFYALARLAGANAVDNSVSFDHDLVLWWLTFTTATLPFALLLMVVYRVVARRHQHTAFVATVGMLAGSIALPHAVNLYAHTLSALLGFSGYAVLRLGASGDDRKSLPVWRLLASGGLLGAAVATEYHLAIVAVVVAAVVFVQQRRRTGWLALGSVPPLSILALYQWRAFGALWHTPFAYYAGMLGGTTKGGYSFPSAQGLFDAVLGNRGLAITGPLVLLGALAALVQCRRSSSPHNDGRRDAVVGIIVFVGYLGLVAGWSGTKYLEEPGPRYLIPAIPFLVAPLAAVWSQLHVIARLAAWWGIALMTAATTTFILVATNDTPLNAYVNRVAEHRFLPTVWSLAFGSIGVWMYVASVVLALRWCWHSARVTERG